MSTEGDEAKAEASKASFKLTLIETIAADPLLQPSDLSLTVAYLAFLTWPARKVWLTTTAARARTGLSERQIATSRARLLDRKYLVDTETKKGFSQVFRVENPRADEMRDHVALMVEHLREEMAFKQADRRRLATLSPQKLQRQKGECHPQNAGDVSAAIAEEFPSYTPQDIAMKEEEPFEGGADPSKGYATRDDDQHVPFPAPASEDDLAEMMSTLFADCQLSALTMSRMRKLLAEGRLTPAIVNGQRSAAA